MMKQYEMESLKIKQPIAQDNLGTKNETVENSIDLNFRSFQIVGRFGSLAVKR